MKYPLGIGFAGGSYSHPDRRGFYAYDSESTIPHRKRDFSSEELLAFELGIVCRCMKISMPTGYLYNLYEDLRSQKVTLPDFYPIQFENKLEADVYGVGSLEYQMFDWWRLGELYLSSQGIRSGSDSWILGEVRKAMIPIIGLTSIPP